MSTKIDSRRELVFVAPDLFERSGGIARISRATVLACHRHCVAAGARFTALSLHDGGAVRDERYLPAGCEWRGFGGDRLALARDVLRRAWARGHVGTVFAHINLASLGNLFPGRAKRFAIVAHGVDVWTPLRFARRRALVRAAEVWPVSEYTGRVAMRLHGIPPDHIRVIQNCLDPFWPPQPALAPRTPPFALAVSRLSSADRYKGIDITIRAFSRLPASVGPVELWIAGDGNDRARLEKLAAATHCRERIRFLGHVSDDRLRELYAGCAFFVLPSAKEGFGLVYLEAMQVGRAVIAATATAVPEIVVDGQTGRLVGPGDELGLAAAMASLFADPELAARFGRAGFERLSSNFGFERYAAKISEGLASAFGLEPVTAPTLKVA
jgi:glycosyltransferase involved in cell wall biosynthesis